MQSASFRIITPLMISLVKLPIDNEIRGVQNLPFASRAVFNTVVIDIKTNDGAIKNRSGAAIIAAESSNMNERIDEENKPRSIESGTLI